MMAKRKADTRKARQKKRILSTVSVFLLAGISLYALSRIPAFTYLRGTERQENPFNLAALEQMSQADRERQVEAWVDEWRQLPPEQQAERADQFLDAIVDDVAGRLDMDRPQTVQMRSLVKSSALVGREFMPEPGQEIDPRNREMLRGLAEQVRDQLENILTPAQQDDLQKMIEERRRRREAQRQEQTE